MYQHPDRPIIVAALNINRSSLEIPLNVPQTKYSRKLDVCFSLKCRNKQLRVELMVSGVVNVSLTRVVSVLALDRPWQNNLLPCTRC